MAGANENSIHQWRVIVVFVVDCECVLTLDESAREHYSIGANEAGSRAHKVAGASAPVVGLQNLCCEFESYCPCQLSPHVLIQNMRTSFCIYRLISCQNIDYNYPIWDISARSGLLGVILSDGSFHFPPFFSLLMAAFRGRNQRFIMECTLLWTIAGYRPQCKVPSKVSQNSA